MNLKLKSLFVLLFCLAVSCQAQKIVQSTNDAIKLQQKKDDFVEKLLAVLIDQIKPEIKFAYGAPDNQSVNSFTGTFIKVYFIDKITYQKENKNGRKPIGVSIDFKI